MSKFKHCHVSDGLMWCQFFSGKWAKPWIVEEDVAYSKETENALVDTNAFSDNTI